jgi:hypothetical protein
MKIMQCTKLDCRLFTFVILAALPTLASQPDPIEIIRKSLERDRSNLERAKDYTFIRKDVIRHLDDSDAVKSAESSTYDTVILDGTPYSRKIAQDDKPLSPSEARKEDEKYTKTREKRLKESDSERQKRLEKESRDRAESRRFLQEIPAAYNLRLAGEENLAGRPAWIIDATPRPGYRPKVARAEMLRKIRGRIWIDQQDYQWVKVDAQTIETVSIGLFLARLAPGAHVSFEQQRINKDLWMPVHLGLRVNLRLGIIKKINDQIDVSFSNYRKFQTDSRIVPVEEHKP